MFSPTTVVLPVIGPYSRIIVHTASFSLDSANIGMLAMSFILAMLGLPFSENGSISSDVENPHIKRLFIKGREMYIF